MKAFAAEVWQPTTSDGVLRETCNHSQTRRGAQMDVSFSSSSSRAALPDFPHAREGPDFPRVHEERLAEQALQRYFDSTMQAAPVR